MAVTGVAGRVTAVGSHIRVVGCLPQFVGSPITALDVCRTALDDSQRLLDDDSSLLCGGYLHRITVEVRWIALSGHRMTVTRRRIADNELSFDATDSGR